MAVNMKLGSLIVLATVLLTGCATVETKPSPDLTYSNLQASPVNAADYVVMPVPSYLMGRNPKDFVVDPAEVVSNYYQHRFRANGAQGKFTVNIMDVSVDHHVDKSESAVGAYLNVDKKDVYIVQVMARLQTYGLNGYETQKIDVSAKQELSISEHVSLAKREQEQIAAIRDMIADLDKVTQRAVNQELRIGGGG